MVRRQSANFVIQRKKFPIGVAMGLDGYNDTEVKADVGEIPRIRNSDSSL